MEKRNNSKDYASRNCQQVKYSPRHLRCGNCMRPESQLSTTDLGPAVNSGGLMIFVIEHEGCRHEWYRNNANKCAERDEKYDPKLRIYQKMADGRRLSGRGKAK